MNRGRPTLGARGQPASTVVDPEMCMFIASENVKIFTTKDDSQKRILRELLALEKERLAAAILAQAAKCDVQP